MPEILILNRAQIKSPHFFNIPQTKVWLLCGYKIDIDVLGDPFPAYWYQNCQSNFVDSDIWGRFLNFHPVSLLAVYILLRGTLTSFSGTITLCITNDPRAIDGLHTAYTLGVFLIDVLFHRPIVNILAVLWFYCNILQIISLLIMWTMFSL